MSQNIPPDFDANWYASTYPDVGLSGLDPREHYRLFGSRFGRKYKASVAAESSAVEAAVQKKRLEPRPAPAERKELRTSAIIDRPQGFDPAAVLPQPGRAKEWSLDGPLTLDSLAKEASGEGAATQALHAYARLLNLPAPSNSETGEREVSCGSGAFRSGPSRIQNAWLAGSKRLRLMIASGEDIAPGSHGWAFRAYQASPASPTELQLLGSGVQLRSLGPVIHDVELVHPLMPLLLELADSEEAIRAIALVPFPSLLPGGLHWAEFKAVQTQPKPMDDFWELSEALLREAIAGGNGAGRSISGVSVSRQSEDPDQRALTPTIEEWLSTVFGIAVNTTGAAVPQECRLVLPPDFVPTIGALVSRSLNSMASEAISGPYLIAEAQDCRPRWSVSLPADLPVDSVRPIVRCAVPSAQARGFAPIPLAIAVRSSLSQPWRHRACDILPASVRPRAITVILDASEAPGVERVEQSIRSEIGNEIQFLVRSDDCESARRAELNRLCAERGWVMLPPGAGLPEIARDAANDVLLTISDRVDLRDGNALRALLDILQSDETAASASCGIVAETITKKQVVLRPASAGLFPTADSLVGEPALSFAEPDALQALPDATYPVIANTLHFTVWRRRILAELPLLATDEMGAVEDIRIGIDLVRAGHRNWCTTKVTAHWAGQYVRREMIDPSAVTQIDQIEWQNILSQVTIIRKLF